MKTPKIKLQPFMFHTKDRGVGKRSFYVHLGSFVLGRFLIEGDLVWTGNWEPVQRADTQSPEQAAIQFVIENWDRYKPSEEEIASHVASLESSESASE